MRWRPCIFVRLLLLLVLCYSFFTGQTSDLFYGGSASICSALVPRCLIALLFVNNSGKTPDAGVVKALQL